MQGFGVHTSLWSLDWTRKAAELAIPEAARYGLAFVEIALLDPPAVDAEHTRALLDKHEMIAVCSLGLPDDSRPTNNPDKALEFLKMALDKTAATGAKALSGVVYGSIGERTGKAPTQGELDAVASVMEKAAAHARKLNLRSGSRRSTATRTTCSTRRTRPFRWWNGSAPATSSSTSTPTT